MTTARTLTYLVACVSQSGMAVMRMRLSVGLAVLFRLLIAPAQCQENVENYDYSRDELFSVIRTETPGSDIFSLPRNFKFPDNAREGSTFIVDFSHHNEEACKCWYDWAMVSHAGVGAVYLKATQGAAYVDPSLRRNTIALSAYGQISRGLYHFLAAQDSADLQAKHFIEVTRDLGLMELPPSLDLEWDPGPMREDCPSDAIIVIRKRNGDVTRKCDRWGFIAADDLIARANSWLDAVKEATGRTPVLYTSDAWLRSRLGNDQRLSEIHSNNVWIADYSKGGLATEKPRLPKNITAVLWQFTDGATFSGKISEAVMDASIFYGNREAFHDYFESDIPPTKQNQ